MTLAPKSFRFAVDPAPCDEFCAYRAVCRYQRPPLEEEP